MATQAEFDLQKTEDPDAVVIAGAAMVGAAQGTKDLLERKAAMAGKAIEPGDQRTIPHPLDNSITYVKELASRVSNAWQEVATPGDMNLARSEARRPHPVDKTIQSHTNAVTATTDMLSEKGLVEGTRASSAVAAGIIAEGALTPSGKMKAVDAALDVAQDGKAAARAGSVIHGEYIAAGEASKAVVIPPTIAAVPATTSFKDAVVGMPGALKAAVMDMVTPPLDTRIVLQARKESKIGVFDHIDETHRVGGDVNAMHARADELTMRAAALAEYIRKNPEAMAQNAHITDAQISALIHDKSMDGQLKIAHNPATERRLPSPDEQNRIAAHEQKVEQAKAAADFATNGAKDMSLGDKIKHHLEYNVRGYTGLGYDMGKGEMARLAAEGLESDSAFLKAGVATGLRKAITTVGVVKILTIIALADEKPIDAQSIGRPLNEKEKLALDFINANSGDKTPQQRADAMMKLTTPAPSDINAAVNIYLSALKDRTKDGYFTEKDGQAMKAVVTNIVPKLEGGEPVLAQTQNQQLQL